MTYLKSGITMRIMVALLAVVGSFLVWQVVFADRVEESPPSYGVATNIQEVDIRVLRSQEVAVTVPVDQEQLQALLDSIYPDSDFAAPASIGLNFGYQGVSDLPGEGVLGLGPTNRMFAFAIARDGDAPRPEIVSLGAWRSDPVTVDAYETHVGLESRLADIKVNIEDDNGNLKYKFEVREGDLHVKIRVEGPAVMVGRTFNNPVPISVRTTNGLRVNFSQQYDFAPCDAGSAHISGNLHLSKGTLKLTDQVTSCQIRRWVEIHADILD
jgi:hypothetical protein